MKWTASAPANIALIKYMGKTDVNHNQPLNASLSYTLNHCQSHVEVELIGADTDYWEPLKLANQNIIELNDAGIQRYLKHVQRLKDHFNVNKNFCIRSGNDFPSDCGLASSASSYAALTKALCLALAELTGIELPNIHTQAQLSQQASGSSFRSFFSPWSIWDSEGAREINLPYQDLLHQVVVVDDSKKIVSSSEAHKQVVSSDLYENRQQRAEMRLKQLISDLQNSKWTNAFNVCWQEFWDMHALFETSEPPFGYMTAESLKILNDIREVWTQKKDGPIVTMDAGANIHLLYRADQVDLANSLFNQFNTDFRVIASHP